MTTSSKAASDGLENRQKIFSDGEDHRGQWKNAAAQFDRSNDNLTILGKPVMERWETPLMHKLADIATSKGGRVLELGFGLGICASQIQTHSDVREHVIVEGNEEVFARLQKWAENAPRKVTPLLGLWQDVAPTLEDGSFDGITYDTYPLTDDAWHTHPLDFIKAHGLRLLKPGGVLTYCNVNSFCDLMLKGTYSDIEQMFNETQVKHLVEAGFNETCITTETLPVHPPADCAYYSINVAIAPKIIKE